MLAFLSPAWLAALHDAAQADGALAAATADVTLVLEQEVTDGPHGDVRYHVVLDRGTTTIGPGPAPEPGIRFSQDHATALGIAAGTDSAQRAFMAGRLRVGGDLRVLLDHQVVLSSLHDVFAAVRGRTDLGTPGADPAAVR